MYLVNKLKMIYIINLATTTPTNSKMTRKNYNVNTLQEQVKAITKQYLEDIGHCSDANVYHKIIESVEKSIFETILEFTNGNQKEASTLSGVSRNTIRAKLEKHNINI